jgi:xanthine dehydrogenase iron-sulfur cluster and FAD-binding subunit A
METSSVEITVTIHNLRRASYFSVKYGCDDETCGVCTPAQILVAKTLLDKNLAPTEIQIPQALNSVLCRCTGYMHTVEAVQRAADLLCSETIDPVMHLEDILPEDIRLEGMLNDICWSDWRRHGTSPGFHSDGRNAF